MLDHQLQFFHYMIVVLVGMIFHGSNIVTAIESARNAPK